MIRLVDLFAAWVFGSPGAPRGPGAPARRPVPAYSHPAIGALERVNAGVHQQLAQSVRHRDTRAVHKAPRRTAAPPRPAG